MLLHSSPAGNFIAQCGIGGRLGLGDMFGSWDQSPQDRTDASLVEIN